MQNNATLSREAWQQVRDLLDDLIERSPEEREKRLAGRTVQPEVLKETRDLLRAADETEAFLSTSPVIIVEPAVSYRSLPEGAQVGAFEVEALVGRGGHGEVYRAFRNDGQFDQQVALKLLRAESLAQFEHFRTERQILATLEHPGISRLIDGGVAPDGRPYMAMEFVAGAPIDSWCRSHAATLETRLRLMLDVCAAVAYAHSQLVVHGDIKPGNILVSDDGKAKLLDFGIARLVETEGGTSGMTTALSTPAYAAPEQLAGRRATTTTDVYALGAVLYELLSGRPAWHLGDSPVSWASRILHDEPPPMSTSVLPGGIAASALRGDLDAIVARALRAEPQARYASVLALAEDIERFLAQRPVLARNGNAFYRVNRFVRRNAVPVAASVALLLVIAGSGAGIAWNMQRAESNRVQAQLEAVRGESLRDFMAVLFRAIYDYREDGVRDARQLLDIGAEQLTADAERGLIDPQTVRALGELYFEVEEFAAAEPFLLRFQAEADDNDDAALLAQTQRLLAAIAMRRGDLPEAERLIAEADNFFMRNPGLYARERAELDAFRAAVLREQGRGAEAVTLLEGAVDALSAVLGENSIDVQMLRQNLAVHYLTSGDIERAQSTLTELRTRLIETGRENTTVGLAALSVEGQIAQAQGDLEGAVKLFGEAVALRRQIYAPSASLVALELNYARGLANLGRHGEALPIYDNAIAVSEAAGMQTGSIHVILVANRGLSLIGVGRLDDAERDIAEALATARVNFGEDSAFFAIALFASANLNVARGENIAARADIALARPLFEAMGATGEAYLVMIGSLEEAMAD